MPGGPQLRSHTANMEALLERLLESQARRDAEREQREREREVEREERERERERERDDNLNRLLDVAMQARDGGPGGARAVGGARLGRAVGNKVDPPTLTFKGGKEDMHPAEFMRRLEDYFVQNEVQDDQAVGMARDCLSGAAADWATFHREAFRDFEDFKEGFLTEFWSSERQDELMNELFRGVYTRAKGDMKVYAYSLAARATYLDPPVGEAVIVRALKKHFPRHIRQILAGARGSMRTVKDLADALGEMEQCEGTPGAGEQRAQSGAPRPTHGGSAGGQDRRPGYNFPKSNHGQGSSSSSRNWRQDPPRGPRVNAVNLEEGDVEEDTVGPPSSEGQEEEEVRPQEN